MMVAPNGGVGRKAAFTGLVILFCLGVAIAQTKSDKADNKKNELEASKKEAFYPQKDYEPEKKKSGSKTTYNAREQFYVRMEKIWKAREKREKNINGYVDDGSAAKFGHKRMPKKRPPGKMKYCKVCGIRH